MNVSLAGPAGTGKTESVKDLAKAMGLLCVVTNCGEGTTSFIDISSSHSSLYDQEWIIKQLERISMVSVKQVLGVVLMSIISFTFTTNEHLSLSPIRFNRIEASVLSVVSTQVKSIQQALSLHQEQFLFENHSIRLINTVGIFVTMNPGYAGRTELPESVKTLFRPVVVV